MANRAMGYSDYYKNNSNVPGSNTDPNLNKNKNTEDEADDAAARRKAAVQRRLRKRKVVS